MQTPADIGTANPPKRVTQSSRDGGKKKKKRNILSARTALCLLYNSTYRASGGMSIVHAHAPFSLPVRSPSLSLPLCSPSLSLSLPLSCSSVLLYVLLLRTVHRPQSFNTRRAKIKQTLASSSIHPRPKIGGEKSPLSQLRKGGSFPLPSCDKRQGLLRTVHAVVAVAFSVAF